MSNTKPLQVMMPEQMKKDLQLLAEIMDGSNPYRHGKYTLSDLIREQCLKLLEENRDKIEKAKRERGIDE